MTTLTDEKILSRYRTDRVMNRYLNDAVISFARAIEQASRAAALEEAYQAAKNESLTDHTGHPEDIAYNGAIRDCLDAISALAKGVSE